jgi:hypothetical protein
MDLSAYRNYQVLGRNIQAYVVAFRQYPTVLDKYLTRFNLDLNSELEWYPLEPWLGMTHGVSQEVGAGSAYSCGKKVAELAPLPPEIQAAKTILEMLDVVYHINHRRDGVVMFDGATGKMLEGIGNYRCEFLEGGSSAQFVCDNPYPCDLDRGILNGFASRFEPAVSVTHGASGCRKKGDSQCTYLVQW